MKKTNLRLPGLPDVPATPKTSTSTKPLRDASISKLSGSNISAAKPIDLGKAPRTTTKTPQSSSSWLSLLSGATSGGLASSFSGAIGLGGGIGSLISGLASLFGGGQTTPPALVAYQLPTSQGQTIHVGSSGSTPGVYGGPAAARHLPTRVVTSFNP